MDFVVLIAIRVDHWNGPNLPVMREEKGGKANAGMDNQPPEVRTFALDGAAPPHPLCG